MHYYHFSLIQCIQFCISLTDDFCRADSGFHRVTLLTFFALSVMRSKHQYPVFRKTQGLS